MFSIVLHDIFSVKIASLGTPKEMAFSFISVASAVFPFLPNPPEKRIYGALLLLYNSTDNSTLSSKYVLLPNTHIHSPFNPSSTEISNRILFILLTSKLFSSICDKSIL